MNPKPIFGRNANLLLDNLIYSRCKSRHRSFGLIKALGEHYSPARWARCVNPRGDKRRSGAFRKQTRQRRSRSQSPKKRCPKAVVASVLIGQNTDAAARA